MSSFDVPLERGRFGQTARRDLWWVTPLLTFLALGGFIVYANWATFQGAHFRYGPYLSPFYSPELFSKTGHDSWFGRNPSWMPAWVTARGVYAKRSTAGGGAARIRGLVSSI